MKALVGAFNQEKALIGTFSVITNLLVDLRLKLYYLLLRTIIYLINARTETAARFSGLLLAQQFLSILAISTAAAFLAVILFEAPIVHMEKLLFAALGVGKKPSNRPRAVEKAKSEETVHTETDNDKTRL